MPRLDGLTLLARAREQGSDAVFVMMTAFATVEAAVEAMQAGAENYLVKPLDVNAVLVVLEKALETAPPAARDGGSCASGCASGTASTTSSATRPSCRRVYEVVKRAAPTRATVLILGESGTGKELIAQALHEESPRASRPFIKVNCAALSETLLESRAVRPREGRRSPARSGARRGASSWPTAGRSSSTRSATSPRRCRSSSCACCSRSEFERVGGTQTLQGGRAAWWPPPTATWPPR